MIHDLICFFGVISILYGLVLSPALCFVVAGAGVIAITVWNRRKQLSKDRSG